MITSITASEVAQLVAERSLVVAKEQEERDGRQWHEILEFLSHLRASDYRQVLIGNKLTSRTRTLALRWSQTYGVFILTTTEDFLHETPRNLTKQFLVSNGFRLQEDEDTASSVSFSV